MRFRLTLDVEVLDEDHAIDLLSDAAVNTGCMDDVTILNTNWEALPPATAETV